MKALYFDCSSGISGNMTLGALLEITGEQEYLFEELKKLKVDGYHMHISKAIKNGITGTYVDVHLESHNHEHHHDHTHKHSHTHHHHHEHRNLFDINTIIEDSDIDEKAKDLAKRMFLRVAKAESKVHNETLENVHFHEVGAIDSIVDIIGTAILITKINPDVIYSSVVNDGYGFIECAHGTISVPVPATSEIFANSNVISRQIDIDTELVTPTGAAIIAELSTSFGNMPTMNIKKVGWGAGSKDLKIPNVLKVSCGEMQDTDDEIVILETNMDDCSGEILGYTLEKLLAVGALDAFYSPIFMKKNRPAYCLTVLCKEKKMPDMERIIFEETTTIGIRYRKEKRIVLPREQIELNTKYGSLKAKKVRYEDKEYMYPEYESAKELAKTNHVSLKEIYTALK